MPSISSLLKSAQATQKKIRVQEDAFIAFEWENSMQTYEDFTQYQEYLQGRTDETSDPSDKLTYQTKLRSARRSYVSNELQRQQMAIMEGRASTQDKMNAVQDLFYQAQENGDLNLAQNLLSQWDALSIKLQNEQESAAKAFASSSAKVKDTLRNDLEKGFDDVTLPTGEVVTPLAQIKRLFQAEGDTVRALKASEETLEALQNVVIQQYENATTQEEVDKLEQQYGPGLADLTEKLTLDIGGKKLTAQDVTNALANDKMNNPIYELKSERNEATGETEYKLKPNNVERIDYARQIDPSTGEEFYVPVNVRTGQDKLFFGESDQGRGLDTQMTDEGNIIGGGKETGKIKLGSEEVNRNDSQTIGNRLKQLGIQARHNGTTLVITLPGEGIERDAAIQPDGSIRYFGDDGQIYEVGLVDRNLGTDMLPAISRAGESRAVAPDEISDFGTRSTFGGRLSQSSAQGNRYLQSITGQTRYDKLLPGQTPIQVGNDFRGYGGGALGSALQGTSTLLQSASMTRSTIQQEQQRQAMLQAQAEAAARLQASQTFDINQTPVQQLASNGVMRRQLQVAAPTAQPRLTVTNAPTQRITSVGVAQAPRIGGVSVAAPRPKLTVR